MDIKDFAEKYIKAQKQMVEEGNFGPIELLESPDIVIHMPPAPDFLGFEAHKQYIMGARESASGIQQEWEYIAGDGNVCVLSCKQTMKMEVDFPLFKIPAGSIVDADGIFILRLEDDRIAETWIKTNVTAR